MRTRIRTSAAKTAVSKRQSTVVPRIRKPDFRDRERPCCGVCRDEELNAAKSRERRRGDGRKQVCDVDSGVGGKVCCAD